MPNQFDTNLLPASTDTYDVGSAAQRWKNLFAQTLKIVSQVFSGSSSGTTTLQASAVASGTLTLPAATDTLVGKATTDTLTNKTLTSPTITNPTSTGTDSGTETLANKTLTSPVINSASFSAASIPTAALAANAVTQDSFLALTVDNSTASATYVNLSTAITITTTGGDVLIFFCGPAHAVTGTGALALSIDGSDGSILASLTAAGQTNLPTSFVYFKTGLAAGSHSFILRGKITGGGTLTVNFATNANGMFAVVELKR